MAEAKIQVEVGQFRFSGEGEQQWLAQQMDKILKSAETLTKLTPPSVPTKPETVNQGTQNTTHGEPLPQFLKKVPSSKQVDIFLATAEWLCRNGKFRIKTGDVSKSLKDAHQTPINNASECLARNCSKGYCAKDGKAFYVTDEGRKHLGLV